MDAVALLSTSDEAAQDFLQQPHLPRTLPIHVFSAKKKSRSHVLQSMIRLYPNLRSVLVFDEGARMRPGMLPMLRACHEWMVAHDDWDLFYFGQCPLWPTRQVAPHVIQTSFPSGEYAVAYHRRVIIGKGSGWHVWRKYAARTDVFRLNREPLLCAGARILWPNIIGLPLVRTDCYESFADDVGCLMHTSAAPFWSMLLSVVITCLIVFGLAVGWATVTICHMFHLIQSDGQDLARDI